MIRMRGNKILLFTICLLIAVFLIQNVSADFTASCYGSSYPADSENPALDTSQTAIDVCNQISLMGYSATAYTEEHFEKQR